VRNAPYIRDDPAAASSKTNLHINCGLSLVFARLAECNLGPGEIESKQSGVYVPRGLSQLVWQIGLMAGNKLGLPFCGSGSPVHGCSTIGLAHSRNLLVSAAAHYLFKITRSLCQMRYRHRTIIRKHGPRLRSQNLRPQKTTPGGEFCPTDVYMLRGR